MLFLRLFYEFFKIGLFSIGGGAATIPFLEDLSIKTGWFTIDELTNMIAIAESTPGAIGVNMSTYVGYTSVVAEYNSVGLAILGGFVATIGLVAPAIIIIMLVSLVLQKFKENKIVNYIFYGLRAASCALILAACYSIFRISILQLDLFKTTHKFKDLMDWPYLVFGVILGFFVFKYKKHPIFYILISAVIGIIYGYVAHHFGWL